MLYFSVAVPSVGCNVASLPLVWQVATFILQKILLDDTGLAYICQTYERFSHVAMILVSVFVNFPFPGVCTVHHWPPTDTNCTFFFLSFCRARWCCSSLKNHQLACWSTSSAATSASQTISGRADWNRCNMLCGVPMFERWLLAAPGPAP